MSGWCREQSTQFVSSIAPTNATDAEFEADGTLGRPGTGSSSQSATYVTETLWKIARKILRKIEKDENLHSTM